MAGRGKSNWTAERDRLLLELYRSGTPVREIAEALALKQSTVESRVRVHVDLGRLRPRRPRAPAETASEKWPRADVDRLVELWTQGLSGAAIARKIGRSKNAVVGKAHRLGLPARPDPIRRDGPPKPVRRPVESIEISAGARQAGDAGEAAVSSAVGQQPPRPADSGERVSQVADRRAARCQWPFPEGEPATNRSGTRFDCENQALPNRPYCAKHCARAYIVKTRPGKGGVRRWRPEDELRRRREPAVPREAAE